MRYILKTALLLYGISAWAAPEITSDVKRIDFGTYPANIEKHHVFKLTNTGDDTLKILNIRQTCGCSKAELAIDELEPGKSTDLSLYIKAESVAGPYSKNVFVQTNDPKTRYLMLSLNGNSVPLVTVKPKDKIYAGTLKPSSEWKQEFILELTQNQVEFGTAQLEGHPAEITLEKLSELQYKLTLSLTASSDTPERFHLKLKLPIQSPANWKPIEITIMGRIAQP